MFPGTDREPAHRHFPFELELRPKRPSARHDTTSTDLPILRNNIQQARQPEQLVSRVAGGLAADVPGFDQFDHFQVIFRHISVVFVLVHG
jgi:hypothetical protein